VVRAALVELDVPPEAALFVGDTFDEDVAGAHAAGVDALWIDSHGHGVPVGARSPRHVVSALTALEDVLASGVERGA